MMNHSIQQTRLACLLSYPNQLPERYQTTQNESNVQKIHMTTKLFCSKQVPSFYKRAKLKNSNTIQKKKE